LGAFLFRLSKERFGFFNEKCLVFSKDRAGSPTKEGKSTTSESKAAALKAAKAKAQKKGTPGPSSSVLSRPASSAFDVTKPHWTLKWASETVSAVGITQKTSLLYRSRPISILLISFPIKKDNIEIKKDTDRIEEIKSLKRAWENHENGRAAKAIVARSKYLKENLIRLDGNPVTDDELEKTLDDELQSQHSTAPASNATTNATGKQGDSSRQQAKTKQSEDATSKLSKGSKQKKDAKLAADAKLAVQELVNQSIDQAAEASVMEEILSTEPPVPPKPKTILPPLDLVPFLRYADQIRKEV
jgi:hypothetical protein